MTQRDLALGAEISRKQLSNLESARSQPNRGTVLLLAECLDVPLRDRNHMLAAAGFDPEFQERRFAEPEFGLVRRDVETVLTAHEPNPAVAVDRHWTILAANRAVENLFAGAEPALLRSPVNLLRLCLHPAGIAPRIVNLPAWRAYLVARLRRQICASGDPALIELLDELRDYPATGVSNALPNGGDVDTLAVPLRLATIDGVLTFLGTTTTFGAASDITLAEISIESFLPGDARTGAIMQARLGTGGAQGAVSTRALTPALTPFAAA
jgi:transcriptional regulator with XRE-family HTH domain